LRAVYFKSPSFFCRINNVFGPCNLLTDKKTPAAMHPNAECRFGRKLSEAFGCAGGIQNGICVKALLIKADAIFFVR